MTLGIFLRGISERYKLSPQLLMESLLQSLRFSILLFVIRSFLVLRFQFRLMLLNVYSFLPVKERIKNEVHILKWAVFILYSNNSLTFPEIWN